MRDARRLRCCVGRLVTCVVASVLVGALAACASAIPTEPVVTHVITMKKAEHDGKSVIVVDPEELKLLTRHDVVVFVNYTGVEVKVSFAQGVKPFYGTEPITVAAASGSMTARTVEANPTSDATFAFTVEAQGLALEQSPRIIVGPEPPQSPG